MKDFSKNIISNSISVLDAMSMINAIGIAEYQTLFILDDEKRLTGTVTDGDIRRALLKGVALTDNIGSAVCTDFQFLTEKNIGLDKIQSLKKKNILLIPVLDPEKRIIKILDFNEQHSVLPIDAVIMAGGKGERLLPLTLNTPKPLLPVGDKAIIEHNIDLIRSYGISKINVTAGHLSERIVDFFKENIYSDASVKVSVEKERLGTIGGLSLISHFENDCVFVMNADLLTDINIEEFYIYFKEHNADMCVATIPYQVSVPYAVLQTTDSIITSLEEKPVYTYYSNAGIYLIKRSMFELIPTGTYFDATDFIELLLNSGRRVHHFPLKGFWLDIGRHEDYVKAQESVRNLNRK